MRPGEDDLHDEKTAMQADGCSGTVGVDLWPTGRFPYWEAKCRECWWRINGFQDRVQARAAEHGPVRLLRPVCRVCGEALTLDGPTVRHVDGSNACGGAA